MAARRFSLALLLGAALGAASCNSEPRPSILLVVVDTARRDAVSAYGEVEGTTPNLDELANEGLLYTRAFAPAPWTLPSHATLFTGLQPDQHRIGVEGYLVLPENALTLAERLRDAGYQTAGFSENPLVGPLTGLHQGFEHFVHQSLEERVRASALGTELRRFDVVEAVEEWARRERGNEPFFAFVNLYDPHDPYAPDDPEPFLPEDASVHKIAALQPHSEEEMSKGIAGYVGVCDRIPGRNMLELLRALYLGEVAAADAKLGRIHETLAAASGSRPLVTIITSDHGELLGERRLLGHEFSVANVLLHVPLIVHGFPDTAPAALDHTVGLVDIAPSILAWSDAAPPEDSVGRPLITPLREPSPERMLYGLFVDHAFELRQGVRFDSETRSKRRESCGPEDRVFGDTLSVIRWPYKLIWFEEGPSELYDLSWDPAERSDQTDYQPERLAALERQAEALYHRLRSEADSNAPKAETPPETLEALRALGYLEE